MTASFDCSASADSAQTVLRFLYEIRTLVDGRLDLFVPSADVEPVAIHSAIRWSLFAGGKRLRPGLLFATGRAFGAGDDQLIDAACAFELIHTYSLIHDDLPSMDDDDLRRGRASCHIKFGEATAILAGDALQALAFQIIVDSEQLETNVRLEIIRELTRAAGTPFGMVAGQSFDLEAESHAVTIGELERIHQRKTGALITAAARCGAIIAGASKTELECITRFASNLGLVFQITDDLLDVTSNSAELGKTPGKDERASKATYPMLYGLEGARELAVKTFDRALNELEKIEVPTEILASIGRFTLGRRS